MKLIFLDFDGVLNTHEFDENILCGQIHKDKVRLLNIALVETGAKLVISSAWRYIVHRGEMNMVGFEWLLRSHGILAGKLHSITRPDRMVAKMKPYNGVPSSFPLENERGQQITDWLAANNHSEPYVVVDDLDLGISEAGHPFVKTMGHVGLTNDCVTRIVELLS